MIGVDEYRSRIVDSRAALAPLELPLASTGGCVLARDIVAPWPLPPYDACVTDGYAVRASDAAAASSGSPVALTVVDVVAAGFRPNARMESGQAMRVAIGAPLPEGADAVVGIEHTNAGLDPVLISSSVVAGDGIRRAAEDVTAGETVLTAGTVIGPRQIAMLAAVGCGLVYVHPRPRIAVLSVGGELVEPGLDLRLGLASDSNSYLLVSAARELGADAYRVGPIIDDEAAVLDAVEDQLHRCDLVVTSGGINAQGTGTVQRALAAKADIEFVEVAMSPGRMQGFGLIGDDSTPIITLPGNAVSAYVSFEVFVRPVLRRMQGLSDTDLPTLAATCQAGFLSPEGKRQFARARFVGLNVVVPVGTHQGPHALSGLAMADALIDIPAQQTVVTAGESVTVIDLRAL